MNKEYITFEKYFPPKAVTYCFELWKQHRFQFKITKPRQTKLGDYSFRKDKGHQITVNGNLNPYAFSITYIHEVAHLVTFQQYKRKKDPHGKEWKSNFKKLFEPILTLDVFPESILQPLTMYLQNPFASTQGCVPLTNALRSFDELPHIDNQHVPLTSLAVGESFLVNGKKFVKGELRRTRFLCTDPHSGKRYVVSANALVKKL